MNQRIESVNSTETAAASDLASRRQFIQLGFGGAVGLSLLPLSTFGSNNTELSTALEEPQFFLQILIPGGMDPTYLFDARPLAMTQAGLIQNYLGQDPTPWIGTNGTPCLATSLVKPLEAYKDYFSVLNGVVMSPGFDGHDQNLNYFLAGDPFGGESFVPHFNLDSRFKKRPVDCVQSGFLFANLSNLGGTIPLTPDSTARLASKIKSAPAISFTDPLMGHIRKRMEMLALGSGRFSEGTKAMHSGMDQTPELANLLKNVQIPQDSKISAQSQFVKMTGEFFKQGVTRSAVLSLFPLNVDAHDAVSAKAQPKTIGDIVTTIVDILKTLKDTPFDSKRSLMDVTTFCVASEFGRTMRQIGKTMDLTGTDHNSLTNSLIVGGSGIRGGQVFGASDRDSVSATVSKAHVSFDAKDLKVMGKPFEFAQMKPRMDLPVEYDPADYLTMSSVANTFYSQFGVQKTHYRKLSRNGPEAKVLTKLLL